MEAATEEAAVVRIIQKADADTGPVEGVGRRRSNAEVAAALSAGTVDVVAGTGWLFARPEFDGASTSCSSTRPARCRWPTPWRRARLRALDRADRRSEPAADGHPGCPPGGRRLGARAPRGDAETMPPERGLFLEPRVGCTRRSTRSSRRPSTAVGSRRTRRRQDASSTATPGPVRVWRSVAADVAHRQRSRSTEEAEVIASAVATLVGDDVAGPRRPASADHRRRHHHRRAVQRPGRRDPFGAPAADGRRGNVGTVDKFQGQEGAVAIYSMASSSRDDAPRDMGFLYCRNRLNVAISQGAEPRAPGRVTDAAGGWLPHARADAPGQRLLPVR